MKMAFLKKIEGFGERRVGDKQIGKGSLKGEDGRVLPENRCLRYSIFHLCEEFFC
ncbi:hypothetical protein INP50_01320 [Chlamydia suis]|uniref:hypothetical protein n=1 Tax=Chlamydia suis TaxID=83559 RepID=UPI0015D84D62|nr:hypothetical protein [Chlamydia suis]QYC90110.1 hypothetical protein INP50_01320 [Chlamydia suis]